MGVFKAFKAFFIRFNAKRLRCRSLKEFYLIQRRVLVIDHWSGCSREIDRMGVNFEKI